MQSWLEFVYDYCLAILGMNMLLHLPYVGHHLDVAAVDVYLNVVSFLLAHIQSSMVTKTSSGSSSHLRFS